MADQQVPQQSPRLDGQHDTSVLSWPPSGTDQPGDGPEYGQPGPGPAQWGHEAYSPATGSYVGAQGGWQPGVGNPEAGYWEARFRRQRTWTRVLLAGIAAALLLFVGGGLFAWNVLLPRAASTVADGLTGGLPELVDPAPEVPGGSGAAPAPVAPDGGDAPAPGEQDLSNIPLPEGLRGLGSMLGIDNLEDLLDTAVSMGLMTPEQADGVREAVRSGQSLEGLLGSGRFGSGASGSGSNGPGEQGSAGA